MSEANPWADLVEAARHRVGRAAAGDYEAARAVLTDCAIAIRGVLGQRQLPDPERAISLQYLLDALEQIVGAGIDARKALGVYVGNRPSQSDALTRDFVLFVRVGREFERLRAEGADVATVRAAQLNVARTWKRDTKATDTVRKAWQSMGGLQAWATVRDMWEES